jgi:hypothetical protein
MLVHRKFRRMRVLAAALGAVSAAATLSLVATPAAFATSTFVESDIGHVGLVTGGGSTVSSDGCVETGWAFQAYITFDGLPEVDYFAFTADHCFGQISVVSGQTNDAVIETRALNSARVVATVPVNDGSSVRIDNTFDAYGAADVGHSKIEFRFDRTMLQVVGTGEFRQATSTGALPLNFATITQNTSHTLLVIHDLP